MEDGRERRGLGTQMGRREWYGIEEERKGWLFKPLTIGSHMRPLLFLARIGGTKLVFGPSLGR
jgi:hypothetical protein